MATSKHADAIRNAIASAKATEFKQADHQRRIYAFLGSLQADLRRLDPDLCRDVAEFTNYMIYGDRS